MPYVTQETRLALETRPPKTPGELTYVLTRTVDEYIGSHSNFDLYATVLGSLEATKLELYRRRIAAHEDFKLQQNGEVYGRP